MEQNSPNSNSSYDYSFVDAPARIAVYDDLLSSPRIIDIEPETTREFINALATAVYSNARDAGGNIPFSIILQVSENFIHSQFKEMVVSILDGGQTIRFADQGPGISDKEKAQLPGYSSATAQMKRYIHGVGSGLPIVREYMETKNGTIKIEDNLDAGAVITISMNPKEETKGSENLTGHSHMPAEKRPNQISHAQKNSEMADLIATFNLSDREITILKLFLYEDIWGVTDIYRETGIPTSSAHVELKKLEEAGIITKLGTKRRLTELGAKVAQNLS